MGNRWLSQDCGHEVRSGGCDGHLLNPLAAVGVDARVHTGKDWHSIDRGMVHDNGILNGRLQVNVWLPQTSRRTGWFFRS